MVKKRRDNLRLEVPLNLDSLPLLLRRTALLEQANPVVLGIPTILITQLLPQLLPSTQPLRLNQKVNSTSEMKTFSSPFNSSPT